MGKGDVLLEVFWKVIDPQQTTTLRIKRSVITEPFTATDYDTLVATKSRAIEKLSQIITKEIISL
jgi:uncharacterized lipoprotein YmbA